MHSCRDGKSAPKKTLRRNTFPCYDQKMRHYFLSSIILNWALLKKPGNIFALGDSAPPAIVPSLQLRTPRLLWERDLSEVPTWALHLTSHVLCTHWWEKRCYYRHQNCQFSRKQGRNNSSHFPCIIQQGGRLVRVCLRTRRTQRRTSNSVSVSTTQKPWWETQSHTNCAALVDHLIFKRIKIIKLKWYA